MSEMSSPAGVDLDAEMAADEPAIPAVKATVYVVGFVGDTDRVLSESEMPEDDSIVWLESAPDDRVTLAELDDRMGEGVIEYDSEPQPLAEAMAAGMGGYTSDLDALEAQLASLEGVVASVMLDTLNDERFLDDEDALTQEKRTMMAHLAARDHLQAMAAAVKEIADVGDEIAAGKGEDPNLVASDEDVSARIAEMRDRLTKLEARIAEMMDESMDDAEMVPSDDMVVDERDL